jgi:hypothetical protein
METLKGLLQLISLSNNSMSETSCAYTVYELSHDEIGNLTLV